MEKINIAELLKNCPKGMELDCTMFDGVTLLRVDNNEGSTYPITVLRGDGNSMILTKYGQCADTNSAKCVIFPKGKTTWEGFVPPCEFKDGDIIYNRLQKRICIYHQKNDVSYIGYCRYNEHHKTFELLVADIYIFKRDYRLATEKEKKTLFDAIKEHGYKWNTETKTLEKLIVPKFKIGDIITNGKTFIAIGYIDDEYYYEINRNIAHRLCIKNQDEWELVPNKFDINTLKPYDKVLVRLTNNCIWMPKFFSHYDPKVKCYPFVTLDNMGYPQCIPYEKNRHLCRTTDDCNKFYKVWEK